jgi:regulator of sigma E protease
VNGHPVTHWAELQNALYVDNIGSDLGLRVDRNGEQREFTVPRSSFRSDGKQPFGIIEAHTEVMISAVEAGMPADTLGLKPEDIIVAVNDEPIRLDSAFILSVQRNAGKELKLSWRRGTQLLSGTVVPTPGGRIGIRLGNYYTGPQRIVKYGPGEALLASVGNVFQSTKLFFTSIGQIITGKSSFRENFGGPIAIAQMATQSAESGLTSFLGFMALLSMSLAVINILPFPALDGGHLAMLAIEKIFRREIPYRVKIAIQQAGFIMLLALMAFVIYNDLSRF